MVKYPEVCDIRTENVLEYLREVIENIEAARWGLKNINIMNETLEYCFINDLNGNIYACYNKFYSDPIKNLGQYDILGKAVESLCKNLKIVAEFDMTNYTKEQLIHMYRTVNKVKTTPTTK